MERELREQPRVLAESAADYRLQASQALAAAEPSMVLLVARGSSDNAALYLRYLIEVRLGLPVVLAAPSVLTVYGREVRYPPCVAIGISQSGEAPDVAAVLARAREQGHRTLAVTNEPDSLVGAAAQYVLDLATGEERSVAATKTYTASLLAAYQIARALGADLPEPPVLDDERIETALALADRHVEAVREAELVFTLGRGYGLATAYEAALKLMECARQVAKPYSSADFEHGPKALLDKRSLVVTFSTPPASVLSSRAKVLAVGCGSAVPEHAPILDAPFAQWLALSLGRRLGLDPDAPAGLRKVTRTL